MKLFIAITLFVAVSALPRRHEIGPREESPIVLRHWEPRLESLVREHQNEYVRIKNILNALPIPHAHNLDDYRKKNPEDVINALNIIHHILNNNEDDDARDDHDDHDDGSIIAINDGEDEDQSDLAPGSEEEVPPHSDGIDSEDENIDNESQQSNHATDGQNLEIEDGDEIPNEHPKPNKNQSPQTENSPANDEIALIDVVQPENA